MTTTEVRSSVSISALLEGHGMDDPEETGRSNRDGGRLPAGRHGLSREFVASNQQARILDAMGKEVAEHGYRDATISRILKRAGVSRKTFYEHFADKEECFLRTYDIVTEGIMNRVVESYREDGPRETWEERVRHGLERLLDVMAREPDFARMCVVEGIQAGPRAMERFLELVNRFATLVGEGREEAPPGVEISPFVAQAVASGVSGILYRRIMADGPESLPELTPELMYFVLAPYLGPERAAEAARG